MKDLHLICVRAKVARRNTILEAVETRLGTIRAPHAIEHLSDNGSAYTARDTRLFAQAVNLIPCFNIVWIFITVTRLADSLRDEFDDRRLRGDGDFGRSLGITYNVLNLLGAIPYIGAIFSIAGLVCFIIYWVKIAGYSRQLFEDTEDRYNSYDERDDRHDDRDDQDRSREYRDDDRDRYDR